MTYSLRAALLAVSASCASMSGWAQSTAPEAQSALPEEIIVTARKRDETSIATPVVLTAVTAEQLERRGVRTLDALAQVVPQVMISSNQGSVQGGNVTIRGISGPDANPFADQAVSFNIDGVQVAKSSVRRLSQMDLQQVEVLKGPQALFFGKNSPAGIISMRTADPTRTFEAKAAVGYETEAREARVEGYVSGPVSDTVGLRLAGYYSNADGYLDNQVPGTSILDDAGRTPDWSEYAFRATAMFEPTPDFSARFKLNVGRIHDAGANQTTQRVDCPFGAPQSGMPVDCKANSKGVNTGVGPVLGTLDPRFRDGDPYGRQKQWLASLELNYALSEQLKLTSVTGFYHADFSTSVNAENDYYTVLPSVQWFGDKE